MVDPVLPAHENMLVRVLLEGAHELLGWENLQMIMDSLSSGSQPTQTDRTTVDGLLFGAFRTDVFLQALEEKYGKLGGRGLALRIGRSAFKNGLQKYGDEAGLRSVDYRLQPAPVRLAKGLQILAQVFSEQCGDVIQVTDQGASWEWRSDRCPVCSESVQDGPCCYLMIGFLQEFMTWAGGGRFYRVTETECRAAGSLTCVFRIDKKPLD